MPTKRNVVYDESKIQTLSSLNHIRLRTGMYIGKLGNGSSYDDGIYVLLKEVIDNSVDEFIEGHGKKIEIVIEDNKVSMRDFGRGIPLGKLVECVSKINTGGKFNSDVFQYSVGLNGVGTKAVNALSSFFEVKSFRDGKYKHAIFERGVLVSEKDGVTDEVNGTETNFIPDTEIFDENYDYNIDFVRKRILYYSFLNRNLIFYLNGEKIVSKNGLLDLLHNEVDFSLYEPVLFEGERIEFVFTHTQSYGETYFSFVNGQYTNDGGTHQSAFREGILKAVNEYAKKQYDGKDVRDGLIGSISIRIKDPIFESQTKNKLGNTDVRSWIIAEVKNFLIDFFYKNTEVSDKILEKINLNEKIRKELKSIQKDVKELSKRTALRIPKLKDCKYHFNDSESARKKSKWRGDESLIFLTEGDSAAGSMVFSRDVDTQAIFALRGKPLNVYGHKRDVIYKNEEFFNMSKALNIDDGLDNLRYGKVVLATDSDPDGLHIRNLLLTFFLYFYENLISKGHIYILETPLFRVRNKKETYYCYNEEEKIKAVAKIKGNPEITRFKGLGEISPKEFGRFIGKDIRLLKINVSHLKNIKEILEFYMGKNTPDRKAYIMDNLARATDSIT